MARLAEEGIRRLRALSYNRISKVEAKKKLVEGVEVQVAENQDYADTHNMEIVEVYKDNLTASRFSRKDRPDFVRMTADLQAGKADVVLVTEQSRLDRQLWNILELVELARTTPFRMIVKTRDDEVLDLSSESGINRAIDQANRDRHESELLSQRIKARKRARARDGLWDGGARPYGYQDGGVTICEEEAAIIRECKDKILAGQSLFSITRELNSSGLRTSTGQLWRTTGLKRIFETKRIIGIRTHEGADYPASWPAIISAAEWEEIQVTLRARLSAWSNRRRPRKYLLTGFLTCGRCGAKMVGHGFPQFEAEFVYRYYCKRTETTGEVAGCGKVGRRADPLDALVTSAVLYRLDSTELAEAFGQATQSDEMTEALSEYQQTKASLGDLLADYYRERNQYARAEMLKLKAQLEDELEAITQRMGRLDSYRALVQIPPGASVRTVWESADLELKRSLIGLLVEKIIVLPGRFGSKRWKDDTTGQEYNFDPAGVEIVWRA